MSEISNNFVGKGATRLQKLEGPNRAKPESRAKPDRRSGGGVWEVGSVSPSSEFCFEF